MAGRRRFGFEATYGRDTIVMRNDNIATCRWLAFALVTLMDEYAGHRDAAVAEGLLNGLSPNALAFVKIPPFAERFTAHREELLERFDAFRPADGAYSPLSFFFNFSHNVVKGAVVDALRRSTPWTVSLNDLLTAEPGGGPEAGGEMSEGTAVKGYPRRNPHRIGGPRMPGTPHSPWPRR